MVRTSGSARQAEGVDEGEGAIEGLAERLGVASGLGEDKAALEAGQGGGGEPVDVDVGLELAGGHHGGQTGADLGLPAVESRGEHDAEVVVAFAQLTNEVGDGTASTPAALPLVLDHGVSPPREASPGVEAGEQRTLGVEDVVVGGFGHGAQQVGLVLEVVVELAA